MKDTFPDIILISLLQKYLENRCNEQEIRSLLNWLKSPDNMEDFDFISDLLWKQIQVKYAYPDEERRTELDKEVDILLQKIKAPRKVYRLENNKRKQLFYRLAGGAVAIILVLIGLNVFYFTADTATNPIFAVSEELSGEKNIRLILADDEIMIFEENTDIYYQAGGNIVISSGSDKTTTKVIETEQVRYNKLIVPSGKRSFLALEDGTKVWINSGTTLEFPALFPETQRDIRVEGEIYIEVAKDALRPFYVKTPEMKVEVLGTRFNVSAYQDEAAYSVVLVQGKVAIAFSGEKVELQPDYMLTLAEGIVETKKVNVYDYISWKDGLLSYSGESLVTILHKLSRYYDIPIMYEEDIRQIEYDGKLVLFDDVEDTMETLRNTNPVTYSVEEEGIYVRKK